MLTNQFFFELTIYSSCFTAVQVIRPKFVPSEDWVFNLSSVVRALVAKTKGPGFQSLPGHAVPFFFELSSIYLLSCEHSLVTLLND